MGASFFPPERVLSGMEPAPIRGGTNRVHVNPEATISRRARRLICLAWLSALPATANGILAQVARPAADVAVIQPPSTQLSPRASAALLPDTVITPRDGPKLIRLAAPGSALTTLRLSIPVEEGPSEAGASQIIALLGLERARVAAAPIGARVEGSRTPWGIAYTVVGPTEDFDYLTYVLREAVAQPRLDRNVVERTRLRVREEAQRERETASGRIAAQLRAAAVPGALPLLGTLASLDAISVTSLHDLWARTHRRAHMSLVVVGPEPVELVLAALGDLGSDDRTPPSVPSARPPADPAPKAEVLRSWYGAAWVAGDPGDPHSAVVASLIARRLRERRSTFDSDVQLWDVGTVRVLAVTGAAYATGAQAMRRRVEGILTEAAGSVSREELSPAISDLRLDLLSGARTSWGLATLVGRYHDATGDADAAYQHLTRLDEVTPESIRAYVDLLETRGHQRAELRP